MNLADFARPGMSAEAEAIIDQSLEDARLEQERLLKAID